MKLIRRLVLSSIVFIVLFSYESQDEKTINVRSVKNEIIYGPLQGNRNLEFGVSNILEEALQDKDYFIDPQSEYQIDVQILFFGVQKAGAQLAIYQRNVSITNIILRGTLYKNGKKVKSKTVKGQSKDISTATLIIDEGGKFSQASVSTALKKASLQLIDNLKL
jgi:uncharacterized lipoprotein YajG